MAVASGCSEERSTEATSRSTSSSVKPSEARTSVSSGAPLVIVPVLSKITVSSLCAVSRASAERMRIPDVAPLPVPTVIDNGVARPRAHGQAMISTETAATSAKMNDGGGPPKVQITNVQIAKVITAGTK